jgi:hypothetical protein
VGVVAFRWDMPLSLRCAFFPILGDTVNGLVGDVIDGRRSMCARVCVFVCECFCGVCKKCRYRERLDMSLTVISFHLCLCSGVTTASTTFALSTALGLGAQMILSGIRRLDCAFYTNDGGWSCNSNGGGRVSVNNTSQYDKMLHCNHQYDKMLHCNHHFELNSLNVLQHL